MAQLSNPDLATDTAPENLSIATNSGTATENEPVTLSPVHRRPKDDHSPSPNVQAMTPEDIVFILTQLGHSEEEVHDAISAVDDKGDIFAIKKYLDDRKDPIAEFKKALEGMKARKEGLDDDAKDAKPGKEDNVAEYIESKEDDVAESKLPVHVFVRMRPLIQSEIEQNDVEIVTESKFMAKTKSTTLNIEDSTARNVRKSAIKRPGKGKKAKAEKKKMKKFKGFGGVISGDTPNGETFKECIMPSVGNIWRGHTVCSFAYGHTGSGKTYTIMGYHKDESPGMYRLTAEYIETQLKELNAAIADSADRVLMSCRFAELYQGKMRDLFGNLVECHVREGDDGQIVIRGPTLKDEKTGKVKVAPLTEVHVGEGDLDTFLDRVTASLALRKQGSSAVHDESSRSHVFLEMELVTKRIIDARTALWNAEADLVPTGKDLDGHRIKCSPFMTGAITHNPETNEFVINEEWKEDPEDRKRMDLLQSEFVRLSVNVMGCKRKLAAVTAASHCSVGGKVVFVDLAGNEWGSDSKRVRNDDPVQMKERQEINKSLLALKECVRAMHLKRDHVPFRDSKLTMVLRPHLKAHKSTAIMIANISPSQQHIKKTFNTLSYAALVAGA